VCLVVLAFHCSDDAPLVVAANRDEFHARPARDADWWPDQPDIVAGRDLQAGGTWLGLHRSGRFGTVTNFRDADAPNDGVRSRGHLVTGFLLSDMDPYDYLATLDPDDYAGFNLLLADRSSLAYLSNRGGGLRRLPPGIYGLSNATLDTPWEKVERSKAALADIVATNRVDDAEVLRLLADREKGPVDEARSDWLPFETAHAITAPFIVTPDYGTRCSTVVRAMGSGNWSLVERRFDASGESVGESRHSFTVDGQ